MGERHVDAAAVERTITVYGDLLYRIALHHLKTREDAEDVAHDVFIKWLEKAPAFSSDEHEKAWLIRTTINACTDFRRRAARRLTVALDAWSGSRRLRKPARCWKTYWLCRPISVP